MPFLRLSSSTLLRFLLAGSLVIGTAWACSVPVFRYALEHWEADPYQAIVFHRGPLTPAQREQIQALMPADAPAQANLRIVQADLAEDLSPDLSTIWKAQKQDAALPHLVLGYPRATGLSTAITSAPLSEAPQLHLADSPARREIVERLGDGQSAVWVMIDSGDAARDDAAAKVLEERLDYLTGVLTLPELDQQDIVNGLISVSQEELRLEFSVLRISRSDAQERTFIPMLLGTEPDLATLDGPIVIPVFGRGRALYALVGNGIRAETIDRAATFLIGKCSCQVKDQNPGMDLLLTADWKALAKASPLLERELPNLSHLAQAAEPVTVTTQPRQDPQPATNAAPASGKGKTPIVLAIVGVLMATTVLLGGKFKRKGS